ncbi:MAG: hypothetical protein GYA35_09145, partial [Thermoanaerobaculaceae bacterium]|nr:hypothetical protein [Thermoanaerobaculaceae bacterium]
GGKWRSHFPKHKKKDSAKGNFARRFLIMFQVAEGKLPADCLAGYLPFSLM